MYSNFPFVQKLSKLHTSSITKVLTDWFNTFGWPERLRSDNGPQFRTEFQQFCTENFILHENSSPYNPQSNGLSESAVKQMKFLLKKTNEKFSVFSSSLLEFRNTPNVSGKSPAQMFFGRRLRGKLPHLPGSNNLDIANAKAGADHRKELMEQREVLPGTSLQPLEVNQKVLVQDAISKAWKETGTVSSIRPNGRSYEILMESGSTILRNRKFLKPILDTENDSTVAPPNDNEAPHEPRRSPRLSDRNEK